MNPRLFAGRRVMWMPLDFAYRAPAAERSCCGAMEAALDFACAQHADPFECPDALVVHHAPFNEWGLVVHDGGPSYVLIGHCPWCAKDLGASRRDEWFDALEAMGIDEPDIANIPPEFLTADWHTTKPSARKET